MKKASVSVLPSAEMPISFKGYRFPPEVISYAVWLYYRFPLSLRMVSRIAVMEPIRDRRKGAGPGSVYSRQRRRSEGAVRTFQVGTLRSF